MAAHRSTQSVASGLQPPSQDSSPQQRRMSLGLPQGSRNTSPRPPSPLRNGYVLNTSTGIDPNAYDSDEDEDEDDQDQWRRSPSPSSSVSHLAASFVQRVNDFVGGMGPKSPSLPSDAELEAEAERERERSRREAEAIMSRDARERRQVEDRVLEMLGSTRSLPPPPSRAQTLPNPNPPSPSNSQKSASWWETAKNKLTPTKELTAAQQVIQDTKQREKEEKKLAKAKEKARSNEWPAKPDTKFSDPSFANLNIPAAPPTRKPVPASPSSPTPSRPSLSNMPPNLTPSPMRTANSLTGSPARDTVPLYAQFSAEGTLDVPGTLLAIAKRFEKLEKWTVGHVRALEDRMNDVERWLVDKEKEKQDTESVKASPSDDVQHELHEMREEMSELQGRVGELGREMAKLATSPSNLSSGPKTQTVAVSHAAAPSTTSVLVQQHTGSSLPGTPHQRLASVTARDSTSPPIASSRRTPSGTRLPYPTGDYTSPSDAFSPTNSPPGSLSTSTRTKQLSISGLPSAGGPFSASSNSSYGLPRALSPTPSASVSARAVSPTPSSSNGLPPPRGASPRASSVSPTPRKRYTVALGDRITGSPSIEDLSSNAATSPPDPPKRTGTPKSFARPASSIEATFFSNGNGNANGKAKDDDEDEYGEETIGKSIGSKLANSGTFSSAKGDYKMDDSPSPSMRRIRAQSAYGFSNIAGSAGTPSGGSRGSSNSPNLPTVAPLKMRSKSSERLNTRSSASSLASSGNGSAAGNGNGTGDGMVSALGGSNKFVDPLVLRKQSRDTLPRPLAMPRPVSGKVPVDKLVAFFEKEKK